MDIPKDSWNIALARAVQNVKLSEIKEDDVSPLKRNYTRGTYAWRQATRSVEKYILEDQSNDPLEIGPPRLERIPYLLYKTSDQFIIEIRRHKKLISTLYGYKKVCKDGECHRSTCALCHFLYQMKAPDKHTEIKIVFKEGEITRIIDPSGVHPKGARSGPSKGPDADQKALWTTSSSQQSPKKGSRNRWR